MNIDLVGVDEFYRGFDDSVESVDKNIIDDVLILKRRPVRDLSSYTYWKYKIIKLFTKQKTENNGYFYTRYFLDTFAEFYQKKNYDYVLINYEFWTDLIRKIDLKGPPPSLIRMTGSPLMNITKIKNSISGKNLMKKFRIWRSMTR